MSLLFIHVIVYNTFVYNTFVYIFVYLFLFTYLVISLLPAERRRLRSHYHDLPNPVNCLLCLNSPIRSGFWDSGMPWHLGSRWSSLQRLIALLQQPTDLPLF